MITFTDPLAYIQAELKRLDLLLHRQILRLRANYQLSLDEFRGLYISDQQVDNLINNASASDKSIPSIAELTERAELLRKANAENVCDDLPFQRVIKEFGLSIFEQDILLLALAPEIDLKYETLFAYLNNDISRKWPTCDLAIKVLSSNSKEEMKFHRCLLPEATLFSSGLLQTIQPIPERPFWLSIGFGVSAVVAHYLLGFTSLDPMLINCVKRIAPQIAWDQVPISKNLKSSLKNIVKLFKQDLLERSKPLIILEGRHGSGRAAGAQAICRELNTCLFYLDLAAAQRPPNTLSSVMKRLALQQRLEKAGIYFDHCETLFDKEGSPLLVDQDMIKEFADNLWPIFISCTPEMNWRDLLKDRRSLNFHFEEPNYNERIQLWQKYITHEGNQVQEPDLKDLGNRFILTPGQIKDAVLSAVDMGQLNEKPVKTLHREDLFTSARLQSDQSLGKLATKVTTIYEWHDLILPDNTLQQVRLIASAIKFQHVIYSEWGFDQRIDTGRGLKVLFAGASGTGKTMTAGIIARDIGLDLYKIDLSGVVSKYIGETEKNLDKIFQAARSSNAILFFDEADALFGKRSEVKDAHDRYANIEIAYLLQKMDEHKGAVILASNLAKNIDRAFSRRIHYIVEFPLPDMNHRERLWRSMFPSQAPLDKDIDFRFLAKQFSISGGDIKNVALDTAFLAVQDGQVITMKQLIKAMARQMIKQGKVPSPTDFKQYHPMIAQ
jgi:hypothetical protein